MRSAAKRPKALDPCTRLGLSLDKGNLRNATPRQKTLRFMCWSSTARTIVNENLRRMVE